MAATKLTQRERALEREYHSKRGAILASQSMSWEAKMREIRRLFNHYAQLKREARS